jgi:hypothetical protein
LSLPGAVHSTLFMKRWRASSKMSLLILGAIRVD